MNMPPLTSILLVALISAVCTSFSYELEIEVSSESDDLGQALQNLTSNTVLKLEPGLHEIKEFIKIKDLSNVIISGTNTSDETIITCSDNLGLVFLNITGLKITGVSVAGCGFFGEKYLGNIVKEINATADIFHKIFYDVKIGLIFSDIRNLELEDVQVMNSTIGMLAINILGNSTFTYLDIANNHPPACNTAGTQILSHENIGGGLLLLYTDHIEYENDSIADVNDVNLFITNSIFTNNSNCNALASTPIVYENSETARDFGYVVSGSGGLSIILAQFTFSVSISVSDSIFTQNSALYGGATYIQQFQGSSGGHVTFYQCSFTENNVGRLLSAFPSIGAGGILFFNSPPPEEVTESAMLESKDIQDLSSNIVSFDECKFNNNYALYSAGLYVYSFYSELTSFMNANQLHIRNSVFSGNSIENAIGLLAVLERKFSSFEPGLQLYLHSVTVEDNNGVPPSAQNTANSAGIYDSLITLQSINTTLSGTCLFKNNQGSSILAITSYIYMNGNISFIDNMATAGGALQILTSSGLVIVNHTNLLFQGNSAAISGGAIYTSLSNVAIDASNIADCFLWFGTIDYICQYGKCNSPASFNFNVSFIDNSAPLGSTVYGSALQTCSWKAAFNANPIDGNQVSGFELLKNFTEGKFFIEPARFSESNQENRVINTLPERVVVEYSNNRTMLTSQPGKIIQFEASALDKLNQSVPLVITSLARKEMDSSLSNLSIEARYGNVESQLGLSGYWFLPGQQKPQNLSMVVYGNYTNNTIKVVLFSLTSSARSDVLVELEDCKYGFILEENEQSQMACSCAVQVLDSSIVKCNAMTNSLNVSSNYWIGETTAGRYSIHSCINDYCKEGERIITSSSDNNQCFENRAGILCGQCSEGYSAVFGSNECLKCDNYNVAWQVFVFLIMGIILILLIGFLDFTMATGYVNGIIFFSNIAEFLIPTYAVEYPSSRILFLFVSLINFDTGVSTCVYHGMTALARSGLSLLFPFYLFFLMGVLIIASRRFSRLSSSTAFSATKTFTTLLILCYSTVFKTCVEIFGLVRIRGEREDHVYVGWRVDPNVEYAKDAGHIVLILLAIFLLVVYIIPFTLLLLSPPRVLSKTKCGEKFRIKFLPLFDAFWNPFKKNLCFWPGFRCLLRLFPYLIFYTSSYPENAFSITLFTALFMVIQVYVQPYKKSVLNKLEIALLFILMFLSVGTLYFPLQEADTLPALYILVMVIILYGIFCAFFFLHIRDRFPEKWNKSIGYFKHFIKAYCCCCCKWDKEEEAEIEEKYDFSIGNQIIAMAAENDVSAVNTIRLRESLLEPVFTTSQ